MKTQTFTFGMILLLMLSLSAFAEKVTKEDAAVVGKNYYWENSRTENPIAYDAIVPELFTSKTLNGNDLYYVFNVNSNDGFIIVAADDDVMPVLGYSFTGHWTGQNIPPALEMFLSWFEDQISEVITQRLEGGSEIEGLWNQYSKFNPLPTDTKSVSPLLTTTWNQNYPYNQQCPVTSNGSPTLVGCAAVSMAQVMKYWSHPTTGTGSNSYTLPGYGTISANFGATTYNYALMPNSITTTNFQVAQLLFHCGVSIFMGYSPTGSAPLNALTWQTDVENALKNNFSYSSTLSWKWKNDPNLPSPWVTLLKAELDLGRPLIYYGANGNGPNATAHQFNCDGYNNNNYFHFNFGWGGYYDAYFSVSNINPGTYNFTVIQGAIFDVVPQTTAYDYGDAPDPTYPTLSASGGACHVVPANPSLYLGTLVDTEADGQPDFSCSGDDWNNSDDEDGVTIPGWFNTGSTCSITVTAFGSGLLQAWMDFNQDGDWADAGEQVFTNKPLVHGPNTLSLSIPASAVTGMSCARFRYSSQQNLGYGGQAPDGEVEDYFVEFFAGTEPEFNMLFSLDIGSDTELSDPVADGDEVFDPGDAYLSPGNFIPMPGTDGFIDDISGFGMDPFPDGGIPGTGAPCLCGMPIEIIKHDFFDMDGIDLAICDLRDYPFGEGMPPVEQFEDAFIHFADSMYISYDDDDFMPYPDPTGSIPRLGFSTMGMLYGQTQTMDEVLEVDINITYPLTGQIMAINPKYDEASIHPNLAPNPDINAPMPNDNDDDVDALDVPANLEDATHVYFSADHEAVFVDQNGNPLNPGSIYLAENGQVYEVINAQTDIGLFPDTDIDAFEFTWIEYPDPDYNYVALAMIFSVDEDDPSTPGDESGGMLPNALYVTWMTGWWFDLVTDGFMDDIDAITIIPVDEDPELKADFSPDNTTIFAGQNIVFTDLSTGNPTNWSWTFNGGNPATFNGSTPPAIVYNNPGTYQVSLTVSNANGTDTKTGTVTVIPQGWQYVTTSVSHLISIPLSANPMVNGVPLSAGDLIGVFHTDQNGNEMCGGYGVWDGLNNISVVAFGDDLTTPNKDGFVNGEPLKWKVYEWSTLQNHDVSVTYDQTMPNSNGNYQDFGVSALLSLNTLSIQTINLFAGWNSLSSYLNPVNNNIVNMMGPISNELIILQNMTGMYWPGAGINTLVTWDTTSGYVAKVSQDAVLTITGSALATHSLTLTPGWHMIPMLSSSAQATSSLFNVPQVMLVKEIAGPGVYWSSMGINTLSMLHPGQSYYVYVTANVTINFPAKSTPLGNNKQAVSGIGESPWPVVNPTPGSHLVAVSKSVASQFNTGDVIGAFNGNDLCVGYTTISEAGNAITIYTDDPTTPEVDGMFDGEQITYRVFDAATAEERMLEVQSGDDAMNDCRYFTPNGISLMELKTGVEEALVIGKVNVFPNPASDYLKVSTGKMPGSAQIMITDILGNEIISTTTNAAETTLDVSGFAEGCYLLRISCDNQVVSKKIVIRK